MNPISTNRIKHKNSIPNNRIQLLTIDEENTKRQSLNMKITSKDYMLLALEEAHLAACRGEVPIGAVIVDPIKDEVIARDGNRTLEKNDPTAHAELLVIQQAAQKLKEPRLTNCDIYVTLEPCPMCAQAISFARIRRLYFGAYDPKGGGVEHGPRIFEQPTCHHRPEVYGGIEEEICSYLLKSFFYEKR